MGERPGRAPAAPAAADAEAVARARGGDHEAFRVLVERHQDRVFRLALRVMRDEEAARDVSQEAFLKAYRSLDRFEGRSSFYTWMYRLVLNLCLDTKRRDRSSRHVEWNEEVALGDAGTVRGTSGEATRHEVPDPAGELERKELRALVTRAVDTLPEDARRTFLLREVDGLRYSEIAGALGIPKGTVMSRLHYARRRIRQELTAAGVTGAAFAETVTEESGA